MSYFATFYSYKGGVGRTLALANVAWLLADHPTEPARVLVVDFDLGAPGLFQVFGLRGAKSSPGIVDYVSSYLQKAQIPDVRQFIHRTAHENIDILPAGKMDSRYQRRLESIDWRLLYESAFGYELIERFKSEISAISPEYDYVLVDSLTGYTDVGGICVNQLPELLILLFRLNQQNLDGIEKVYLTAVQSHGEDARKSVIPVITPSWPFIDEAATKWIGKAKAVFSDDQLLEISFDSSLSFGERIISKEANNLPLGSKLLHDYRQLANEVRNQNPTDCLTIWNRIQRGGSQELGDQTDLYLSLLKRRPRVLEYWRSLRDHSFMFANYGNSTSPQGWDNLKSFTDEQSEQGNKFALLARAGMHDGKVTESSRAKSIADLNRALDIDPQFSDALLARGRIAFNGRRYDEAANDYSRCLALSGGESELGRSVVRGELAETYLRMFDGKRAIVALGSLPEKGAYDMRLYQIRAKALYLLGDYSPALADTRTFAKLGSLGDAGSLLPSQILAAMGNVEEAKKELEIASNGRYPEKDANLAEAYLAIDPSKTIALLKEASGLAGPAIRRLLVRLARILSGDLSGDGALSQVGPVKSDVIDSTKWNFFEVVALLLAKERSGQLRGEALHLAYEAIRLAADPIEFSSIQRLRSTM